MIDFSGKIIWVKDSEEADCLLKMAISQGYKPCIGEKAMTVSKLFSFTGDHVIRPCTEVCLDKMESFRELLRENDFGIVLKDMIRYVQNHSLQHVSLRINESEWEFSGFAKTIERNGEKEQFICSIKKPIKVTMEDIEKKFGCPVEIVPSVKKSA